VQGDVEDPHGQEALGAEFAERVVDRPIEYSWPIGQRTLLRGGLDERAERVRSQLGRSHHGLHRLIRSPTGEDE
jgi:hypothetical protein